MSRARRLLLTAGGILATCGCVFSQSKGIRTVIQKSHSDKITAIDFSRDGRFFVTGSADHSVKLWDLRTARELRTFKGHLAEITDVQIDDNNATIVSSAGASGTSELRVWNVQSGEEENEIAGGKKLTVLGILTGKIEFEWAFAMRSFDMRQDGMLVWAEDNHGIKVGSISRNKYDRILPTNWQPTIVRFSPDGKRIAAGGQSLYRKVGTESNEVLIWNADNTAEPASIRLRLADVTSISFDRTGNYLAVLTNSNDSTITHARGPQVFTTFQNAVEVFDIKARKKIYDASWLGFKSETASLSPDGMLVAVSFKNLDSIAKSGSANERIVIHDLKAKRMSSFDSRESEIYSMGFSPDGRLLIANGLKINFWRVGSWTNTREVFRVDRIDDAELFNNKLYTYRFLEDCTQVNVLDLGSADFESLKMSKSTRIMHKGNSVFVAQGGRIEQYDAGMRNRVKTLLDRVEGWEAISDFYFSADGSWLVCLNNDQNSIFVKPLDPAKPGFFLTGHRRPVNDIAISGKTMASGSQDNRIFLWDLTTRSKKGELLGHNNAVIALAFHPEGRVLASGSEDKNIKLWDVGKMEQIETLRGNKEDVLSLAFSKSGEYLVSGSGSLEDEGESEIMMWDVKKRKSVWRSPGNDGYTRKVVFSDERVYTIGNDAVVKFLDPVRGEEQFFFIPLTEKDFVLTSRDNYYISTKASLQFVHFVKGTNVYAFDNFDLKYNRPDLVLEKLGSQNKTLIDAYRKNYLRRLKRSGFTEAEIDGEPHLPGVSIMNLDSLSYVAQQNNAILHVEFSDERSSLKYYNVWVNGVPLWGYKGKPVVEKGSAFRTLLDVPLSEGYNKIEVGCTNVKGAKSPREMIEVVWHGKRKPELYLVTVCAAEYANASLNLTYSVKDGKDIGNLFRSDTEFGKVHLSPLFNNQVTKASFISMKQQLLKSTPDDEVIVFMAGHGVLDKNFDFHFVTYDVDMSRAGETAISFDNIESFIDSIPARKKMVLLDACHSGGIDKEAIEEKAMELVKQSGRTVKVQNMDVVKKNVFSGYYGVDNTFVELMEEMFHNLGEGSGAYVISAASGNGYALESEQWNNGVFTYSILDGLKNGLADKDKNGAITVSELKTFLSENVPRLTDNRQRPTCRKENPDLDFVVWRK